MLPLLLQLVLVTLVLESAPAARAIQLPGMLGMAMHGLSERPEHHRRSHGITADQQDHPEVSTSSEPSATVIHISLSITVGWNVLLVAQIRSYVTCLVSASPASTPGAAGDSRPVAYSC